MTTWTPPSFDPAAELPKPGEQTPAPSSVVYYEDESAVSPGADQEAPPTSSAYGTVSAPGYGEVGPPEYGTTASAAGFGAAGTPEYGTTTGADGP
jgi:hypothetical protein